tara:strand:+ start:1381 stop:1806 length:426 start_codon:yes stop_codon:yes gene_type:complete
MWVRRPAFTTLLRIILEQQVSLASGRAAYRRIEGRIGTVEVAKAVQENRLNLQRLTRAPDEEARAELLALTGVGRWTADVYLLMALKRPDIWPPGDVALLIAVHNLRRSTRRPSNEEALQAAEAWRPYRAVATRILWHGYL